MTRPIAVQIRNSLRGFYLGGDFIWESPKGILSGNGPDKTQIRNTTTPGGHSVNFGISLRKLYLCNHLSIVYRSMYNFCFFPCRIRIVSFGLCVEFIHGRRRRLALKLSVRRSYGPFSVPRNV